MGDDNAISYNQLCGIRLILYSTNNRSGLYDQNLTKVTNWPKSGWPFPGSFDKDSYKGYTMNAGFEILHLKDCDDFVSTFGGSYAHGGFRGATVENSSVTGNLSLEQYLYGWNIVSGNKNCSFRNKTATTNRDGPAGADTETFGIKLGEDFTGTIVEDPASIHGGSFSDYALIENGTLHGISGSVRGAMMGIRIAEKGSAIIEDREFKHELTIYNEGSLKLFNCTMKRGIYHPYAEQFRADNTIEDGTFIAARLARRTWQSYGMTIDTNGLEYVGSALAGSDGGFAESDVKAKTTTGQFNFTVQEPDFINNPPASMTFSMVEGYVPTNTVLELWYYGTGGWTRHPGTGNSWSLSGTAFGQQGAGENVPDLRLVVTGDSPSVKGFKISADFYQPAAPKAPTGLVAAAGDNVVLDWDDHLDLNITYNVYRRNTSSGAFGDPIATNLGESTYADLTASGSLTNYYVVTAVDADGLESAISFETDTAWEPEPVIITQVLPAAILYHDYAVDLLAAGEAPFTWSWVGGALPMGLTLSSDGSLSGRPMTIGEYNIEIAVSDGVGGEAATNAYSLAVIPDPPTFFDDFEDDTPLNTTNSGLDIRPDDDGTGEDEADFGFGYSSPTGEYEIRANPEMVGNTSSHVLFMNQIGSGIQDVQYIDGYFTASCPIDGMEVSFDFYNTYLSGSDLYSGDSVRLYLVGTDNASVNAEIRLHRNGDFYIDGSAVNSASPVTNAWQRFSGIFKATATPGVYNLEWTLENLETSSSASGTTSVNLNDGAWAANSLDLALANGIRLYVHDKKNNEDYLAYFDNVRVNDGGSMAPYDAWVVAYGGEALIGTSTNDYDGDGEVNFAEYALGGNPTNGFYIGAVPFLMNTDSGLHYVHAMRSDDPSLIYSVETCTNLVSGGWTNSGVAVLGTNLTGSTLNYVTNEISIDKEQTYIRLKVSR